MRWEEYILCVYSLPSYNQIGCPRLSIYLVLSNSLGLLLEYRKYLNKKLFLKENLSNNLTLRPRYDSL